MMKKNLCRRMFYALAGLMLPVSAMAFDYDCLLEPHRVVEIKTAIVGRIETIKVERSDLVKAGQPVVIFESKVEKATVELASAKAAMMAELNSSKVSHKFSGRKLRRFGGLAEEGVVAVQTRDEVETEEALARLQIEQARENRYLAELELARATAMLDQHTIASPIDGVVIQRFKSVGEYPDDGPILTLAQLDPLNVEVLLPASQFGSIKPGMKAMVMPEAPLQGSYAAEVKIVDRVVDASSGMFGVRLELPNPEHELPGGLRCTVNFSAGNPSTISRGPRAVGAVDLGMAKK